MNVIISKIASVSLHRSMSGSQRTCWVSNESLSSDRWNVLFLRGRLWRALPVWGRKYWNINIRFLYLFQSFERAEETSTESCRCFKQRPAQTHLFMKMTRISSWILAAVTARWRPVRPEIPRHRHQCDFRLKTVGKVYTSSVCVCVGRGCVCWSNSHPGGALLLCVCLRGGGRTSGS